MDCHREHLCVADAKRAGPRYTTNSGYVSHSEMAQIPSAVNTQANSTTGRPHVERAGLTTVTFVPEGGPEACGEDGRLMPVP